MLEDNIPQDQIGIKADPPAEAEPREEKLDPVELQRQLNLEKQLREQVENERDSLREIAKTRPAEKQERKEEPLDIDELSELDLVEIVSGNDKDKFSKAVRAEAKKLLKEMGVTTKGDVEQLVASRFQESQSVAELVQQYPDLADEKSDLRQEAARQLDAINKDAAYKGLSDFGKAKLATRLAAAELKQGSTRQKEREDPQEENRLARIAAQQGVTGARSNTTREKSTELTPQQKEIARVFGVSEEVYKQSKSSMKMFRPRDRK